MRILSTYAALAHFKRAVFATESFLDAIALHEAAGDEVLCIAAGSSNAKPQSEILRLIVKHPLVYLAHDRDQAGGKMRDIWASDLNVKIRGAEVPGKYLKDIGEAVEKGMPHKEWMNCLLNLARLEN